MGNGTNGTSNATWTSTQAYVLAVICLIVGVGAGWVVRGSSSAETATSTAQAGVPAGMPGGMGTMGQQQMTPEQMKHMADKQAEPLLERLKTDPKNVQTLSQVGNIYYDTQNYKEAVEYYAKALEVRPEDPNIRTDMGTAYYYMGDADRALKEFDTALKYDPKHGQTMFNVGMVKWQGKADVNGAVAAWENLLKTVPDYPERDKVQDLIAKAKQHSNIKPGTKTDKPATM